MAIKVPPAAGVRAEWPDLPAGVRAGIEDLLGAPVVAAVNQAGGFSPGLAARVRCADGSRAFVKQPGPNAGVAVPRLRATYDDVGGSHWFSTRSTGTHRRCRGAPTTSRAWLARSPRCRRRSRRVPVPGVADIGTTLRDEFTGYARLLFLVNAALHGHDPQAYLDRHPLLTAVDPWYVTGLLAGLAGMWADATRRPPPPGLPTVRAFQQAQLDVTLDWLRMRTGWR
ncbi:MAG TPA: hypothetical protein VK585_10640 [Jiangellaceae bacterium]|nr:hypothetical protein [Jiangellaceae bacterium]